MNPARAWFSRLGFRRASRMLTVASAAVLALTMAATLSGSRRVPPGREHAASPRPAAGLERVDFGAEPTVDPTAPLAGEVPRRVLAIYSSEVQITEDDQQTGQEDVRLRPVAPEVTLVHRHAELPLNHLGLVVDYRDASGPLPGPAEMQRYRGILVWLNENRLGDPDALLEWLIREMGAGRRVVLVGDLPTMADLHGAPPSPALAARFLEKLGGRFLGTWTEDPTAIHVAAADRAMVGFERHLPERLEVFQRYAATPAASPFLTLGRRGPGREDRSDVGWTSPSGGFLLGAFATIEEHVADRYVTRWLVDPFRFFERAFGLEDLPRLDFTTLNGRRLYYGHIDGDGMEMISELDYRSRCGAVIRDTIIKRYDLPFTASVVVGATAPPPVGRGTPEDVAVIRSIFALDNVEVGSHGYAHPIDWRAGPAATLSVPDLPDYRLDGENEVGKSVAYIDAQLAPPGKPCRIMLWTGSCNPSEDQLAWAYRLHLRNLNGGDPRMDAFYPSYAHLVPPAHPVGRYFQYFTSAANDYIHTQDWRPPYYRFQNVVQTFERSGRPRRVVPVNVYFHFYSARNQAALTGLERALDWAVGQPLAPVFASEYVDIARDFQWARVARRGADRWVIRKGPYLRTVRFDRPDLSIDRSQSRGVLGYLRDPDLGVTYVHLSQDEEVELQLRAPDPGPELPAGEVPAGDVRLEEGSHWVDALATSPGRIEVETRGTGRKRFVIAGLIGGASFRVHATAGAARSPAVVGPDGRLTLELEGSGAGRVRIVAERMEEGR